MTIRAFVFDVDGTLAETEEVHRASFNQAFAEHGLGWSWDRGLYRDLLRTTGGRERILAYAARVGADVDARALHSRARSAGLRTVVAPSIYRADDDFTGANLVVDTLDERSELHAI